MAKPILTYHAGGGTPRSVTGPVLTATTTSEPGPGVEDGGTPILNYLPDGGPVIPSWPPTPSDLTYPECGTIQLVSGQSYIDVTFVYEKPDANWIFEDLQILNTTDPTPLNIWPGIVTEKSITGFRLQIDGLPDTDNYFLHWAVGGCATSDWVVSSGATTTNFLQLTDTPNEYTGQAGMGVKVNTAEDGLEFGSVGGGTVINVKDYGALGDTVGVTDGAITAGTATFSNGQWNFTDVDIGKSITVSGAGDPGQPKTFTIIAVSGGVTCTLDSNAVTTVSGVPAYFGTDDAAAFVDAVAAMEEQWLINTAYHGSTYSGLQGPVPGGVIYIPQGNYYLGENTTTNGFMVPKANVKIIGDGIGKSTLTYSSRVTINPPYYGFGIMIGSGSWFGAYAIIEDLTIRDINSDVGWATAGSGIQIWYTSNVHINRVELINCKGNAAITLYGLLTGGGPLGHDVHIKDCIIRSGHEPTGVIGGFDAITGDAINVGNYYNVHVTGNRIYAPGRHGYEGGGSCYSQFFDNNEIDMGTIGGSGINPTGGSRTSVTNNKIYNVYGAATAVDFTTDVGIGFSDRDIVVSGNYLQGGLYGIRFQNTGSTGTLGNFIVANNWIESDNYGIALPLILGATTLIHGNLINTTLLGITVLGSGTAPPAGATIDIRGNVYPEPSGGNGLYYPPDWSAWNDAYALRVEGNTIGRTLDDLFFVVGYGTVGAMVDTTGGSIAAGGLLTLTNMVFGSMPGVRANDLITVLPTNGWANNLIYWGKVTASDAVTVYVFNPTGGSVSYPANAPNYIYVFAHRQ